MKKIQKFESFESNVDIPYENVKGVYGLCTRDGHVRNNEQLHKIIREKNVGNCNLSQYNDPDGDYIWCVFYEGNLGDKIENVVEYIMNNDQERFW